MKNSGTECGHFSLLLHKTQKVLFLYVCVCVFLCGDSSARSEHTTMGVIVRLWVLLCIDFLARLFHQCVVFFFLFLLCFQALNSVLLQKGLHVLR